MFVSLPDGTPLRGDVVLKSVQRFDLTPIPSTLELTLRVDSSVAQSLQYDSVVIAGSGDDKYRILKIKRAPDTRAQSGDAPEVLQAIALLDGFGPLAWPLPRAVVKEQRSMGEVYRSCGATARIGDDIPMHRFVCFAGQFPTEAMSQLLQEEACAPVWTGGRLSFKRLADLFAGNPVEAVDADTTQAVESPFLERHDIPWAMSNGTAGDVVLGRRDIARSFVFLPRTPERILNNMTRCLVVRRTLLGSFAGHIRAGDGVDIAGKRHVVVTAAHSWESDSGGQGSNQVTRLWLGQLQR